MREKPALSSTMKSPISVGISCATIASAVTMPSSGLARKAAAIRMPSVKLCMPSPIRIIQPDLPASLASWPCAWWWPSPSWWCEWRSSASFSSMKKVSRPASRVANSFCGLAPESKASGKACSSEVDSMMPTDRLTSRSTILESSVNENRAAAEMLTTPAKAVAVRMDRRIGSI